MTRTLLIGLQDVTAVHQNGSVDTELGRRCDESLDLRFLDLRAARHFHCIAAIGKIENEVDLQVVACPVVGEARFEAPSDFPQMAKDNRFNDSAADSGSWDGMRERAQIIPWSEA